MTRERLAWVLAVLGLLLGAWWLAANTEWVDDSQPRAMRGEALRNPVYAAEQLLRQLGVKASHHESLQQLPPPGARLVLLSADWRLKPGSSERIKAWVEQGGHLVLTRSAGWDEGPMAAWLPLRAASHSPELDRMSEATREVLAQINLRAGGARQLLVSAPALWAGEERLSLCGYFNQRLQPRPAAGAVPLWTLRPVAETDGVAPEPVVLRMAFGRGSVTALGGSRGWLDSGPLLRCDNPLLLAGLLQAQPGAEVWFYLHEEREALLPWLWQQAAGVLLLGLLALAAALWRATLRFGPLQAGALRPRRSVAEQVQGLAAFLNHGGREALLQAQQRALNDTARRRLPQWACLRQPARRNARERAACIAQATGLPAEELVEALSVQYPSRPQLPRLLQLLETARRRLLTPESPLP